MVAINASRVEFAAGQCELAEWPVDIAAARCELAERRVELASARCEFAERRVDVAAGQCELAEEFLVTTPAPGEFRILLGECTCVWTDVIVTS
jgi:hypothetical protein